jgi:hypothetical protein
MNGHDAALVTGKQVIDKITDDRVGFVSEFCYHPAGEHPGAAVPFEIDRAMRGFAVDFGPPVGAPGTLMFSGNQSKPLELRIGHDLFPQRSTPGRDDLDHCLHPTSFSRKSSLLQCLFGTKGPKPRNQEATDTLRKHRRIPFRDDEMRPVKCPRFSFRDPAKALPPIHSSK